MEQEFFSRCVAYFSKGVVYAVAAGALLLAYSLDKSSESASTQGGCNPDCAQSCPLSRQTVADTTRSLDTTLIDTLVSGETCAKSIISED